MTVFLTTISFHLNKSFCFKLVAVASKIETPL